MEVKLKVYRAKTVWIKILGQIGLKKPIPLLLKTRFGIHTFGVLFPIDILILDHGSRIVQMKENLPPNRIFFWNPRFDRIIELPAGIIKQKELHLSQQIKLEII